eukprot:1104563-Amphidinium_carterae.1
MVLVDVSGSVTPAALNLCVCAGMKMWPAKGSIEGDVHMRRILRCETRRESVQEALTIEGF